MPNLTFSHNIEYITFGDEASLKEVTTKFSNTYVSEFNRAAKVGSLHNESTCFYYMKAVPLWFFIGSTKISQETYQYSIDFTCEDRAKTIGGYQVTFVYDMSPIGIVYKMEEWSVWQMLVSVSAIVSGVYVLMGLLYRVFEYLLF